LTALKSGAAPVKDAQRGLWQSRKPRLADESGGF
jgi:hypothetical protein